MSTPKVIGYATNANGSRFFPITEENLHLFEKPSPSLTDDLDDEAFMAALMADSYSDFTERLIEANILCYRSRVDDDFDTAFTAVVRY